uniref:Uncharacterized protein n=1 Tax=Globodera rostochiensis TaxID=31243 RepID=A0A914I499_GLORO
MTTTSRKLPPELYCELVSFFKAEHQFSANPCTLLKMKLQSVPESLQLVSVLEADLKTIARCYASYSHIYGQYSTQILNGLQGYCPAFRELMSAAFSTHIKFLHGDGSTQITPLVGDAYWMMTPFLYLEKCPTIVCDGEAAAALTMLKADVQRVIYAYKKFSTALEAGHVDTIVTNPSLSAFVIRTFRDMRLLYRPFDELMRCVEQFSEKYSVPESAV